MVSSAITSASREETSSVWAVEATNAIFLADFDGTEDSEVRRRKTIKKCC